MREVIVEIESWRSQGKPVAIATNVKKTGSSLRPLGAKMAMTNAMEIAGSVTGGCIEGAVYDEGQGVLRTGQPRVIHYGVVDPDSPWDVGLSCGGTLDVLVETLDSPAWAEVYSQMQASLERNELLAVATVISGMHTGAKLLVWPDGRWVGNLPQDLPVAQVAETAREQMHCQQTCWLEIAGVEYFIDVQPPPARLIVVGAVHITIPLVALAKTLGFHTTVIDPRSAFATMERFPNVDALLVEWPADALQNLKLDEGCYIAVLSHDEKMDNPALAVALTSPARYVGVLGARNRLQRRHAALLELGVPANQLPRLCAPVGMNLGAVLPDEIALSILAEMIAARHGALHRQEITATVPV